MTHKINSQPDSSRKKQGPKGTHLYGWEGLISFDE